ncbi:MAG: MotA/TolQ/ExbB proton channel family protein [Elusimicrobiales bacterium]|nr:MotA/TolQ/ExbB proton channel family protein [Elusimicrobiales bacterium]
MRSSVHSAIFAAILVFFVYLGEGMGGFRPFLNLEALLIVFIGLGLFLAASYSAGEVLAALRCGFFGAAPGDAETAAASAEILEYAASGAVKVSVLGTLFALILVLSSPGNSEAGVLMRRLALALDVPFFGYFLASMVFTPMARRVSRQAAKR